MDLRRSPFIKSFRAKYQELSRSSEPIRLLDHYREGLEKLSDQVRPNVGDAIIKAVLTNLPIPVVNPFHVAASANEVWETAKLKREFGWLFFLRDIRQRTPTHEGNA